LCLVFPPVWAQSASTPQNPAAPARPERVTPAARIVSFTVKPETIQSGQPVLLVWATENPSGVTIDPEVGRVSARGSRQVFPTATTVYTLKVGGPGNASLTQTVKVTVSGPAGAARPAAAAAAPAAAKDPRMPDGKPDLTGVYG